MNKFQPLISIIIVTYNACKTLQDCLNSIFSQTYKNIEVVIFDGLSTDNTVEIISSNENKISFWKSEKDNGIYDAMNKAIDYCNGDRIFFLGADDYLLPDFSKMPKYLIDENIIYHGKSRFKKRIEGRKLKPFNLAKGNIVHQSIFYPKSVFKNYRYELKYTILADYYLNIKCYNNPKYSFEFIPIIVSIFTAGGVSSTQKDHQFEKDKDEIVKQNFSKFIQLRYILRKFKKKIGL
jgi:glycosyltransferase involved in cell wall biosynthesis